MNVVALIPAKGTSRRIPGKNLRILGGMPLVAWTIRAAFYSKLVTRVVVSTEDGAVAAVAREHDAEVLERPEHLAHDPAEAQDVAAHAFALLAPVDVAVMLLPTSPFRTGHDIDEAVRWHLVDNQRRHVVSVTSRPEGRFKWYSTLEGGLEPVECEHPVELNGAIYVGRPDRVVSEGGFTIRGALPHPIPNPRGLDIDREADWQLAEALLGEVAV